MFTGIIQEVGRIIQMESLPSGHLKMGIATKRDQKNIQIGASIACDGVCLTVESMKSAANPFNTVFFVTASAETTSLTTLNPSLQQFKIGHDVNLEGSLHLGDELGGHFVFGHVDRVITLKDRQMVGSSCMMRFDLPSSLAGLVVKKGSVALNGVSLTVNKIEDNAFEIMLIPHSLSNTNLQHLQAGDKVNFEADMLARYVLRQNLLHQDMLPQGELAEMPKATASDL
ncbi:MAG: riboflavin synthase [Alphaproteobacteria bacterium]